MFNSGLPLSGSKRKPFCRVYGSNVVCQVTLDQVYSGARGIKSLVWEVCGPPKQRASEFNHSPGFCSRSRRRDSLQRHDGNHCSAATKTPMFTTVQILECQKLLPKAPGGDQPLPEGVYLFCTSTSSF